MPSIRSAVVMVVAVMVAAVVGGVLVPVGIGAIVDDETVTLDQDNGTTYEVNGALDTQVTNVQSGTPNNATIQLDTDDQTVTNTIDVGSEADYSFDEGTVTVGLESATTGSPDTATANYTYPAEFAQSGGASALWSNLDLFVVLGLLGIFVLAMREQF